MNIVDLDLSDQPSGSDWRKISSRLVDGSIAGPIQSVNLRYNRLDPQELELVLSALARLPDLEMLDLSGMQLDAASTVHIGRVLPELKHLRHLQLTSNDLDADAMSHLAAAIASLSTLQSLNLMGNRLDHVAMANVSQVWLQKPPPPPPSIGLLLHLSTLNVAYNHLGAEAMATLAPVLGQLPSLTALNLSHNRLDAPAMEHLASALPHLTSLKELYVSANPLDASALSHLAPALRHLSSLQRLNLSRVGMAAPSASVLAPHLDRLHELRHLDLRCNALDAKAMEYLAPPLRRLPLLAVVDVRSNQLNAAGFATLAAAAYALPHRDIHLNCDRDGIGIVAGVKALRFTTFEWICCGSCHTSWRSRGGHATEKKHMRCCNAACEANGEGGCFLEAMADCSESTRCDTQRSLARWPGVAEVTTVNHPYCAEDVNMNGAAFFGGCHDDFLRGARCLRGIDLTPMSQWWNVGHGFLADCHSIAGLSI